MKFWVEDGKLNHEGEFPSRKRDALNASIKKWQSIAKWHRSREINQEEMDDDDAIFQPEEVVIGVHGSSCALCQIYTYVSKSCNGCPVMESTGLDGCRDTPYIDYIHRPSEETAQAEVDFLVSLREG